MLFEAGCIKTKVHGLRARSDGSGSESVHVDGLVFAERGRAMDSVLVFPQLRLHRLCVLALFFVRQERGGDASENSRQGVATAPGSAIEVRNYPFFRILT